jgi:hypothetical protein
MNCAMCIPKFKVKIHVVVIGEPGKQRREARRTSGGQEALTRVLPFVVYSKD